MRLALGLGLPSSFAALAGAGAAALLTGETSGFASDFTYQADAQRVAVKNAGAVALYAPDAFFANGGTSPKLITDAAGVLAWSPHNLFLNSGAPATQSVTLITGATYTVTVAGTGSLTGSSGAAGVATAGAPLTFVASGTTGTFTLSGSLTTIQINRGSAATAYLATTAAARYGLAIDYAAGVSKGLLVEPAATNVLLNSVALATQSVTVTAQAYTLSFYGTGTVTLSGVSTAGPLVGTGANNRVSLPFTPTAGSLALTISGTVTRAQLEAGSRASSPIETFAATVTRAKDTPNFLLSAIPWNAAEGTVVVEAVMAPTGGFSTYWGIDDGGATEEASVVDIDTHLELQVRDGGVGVVSADATRPTSASIFRSGAALKANDFAHSVNGGSPVVDTSGGMPTVTTFNAGFRGAGAGHRQGGYIRKIIHLSRRVTNAELQALSVPA